MLYSKNKQSKLDDDLFRNPTSEYRAAPFWAWNGFLTVELLTRQIEYFKQMGFGGFHMHSRTGLAVPYLKEQFMTLVKACIEKAKNESMLAWLYDEDRWPSGAAGGFVTKNRSYRMRYLLFTPFPYPEQSDAEELASSDKGKRQDDGILLARYAIALDHLGCLSEYRILQDGENANEVWYAYLEIAPENPWYNNQAYVNTLDKKAIDEFIRITYESYRRAAGEEFGKAIPAIFTDEPQFRRKTTLAYATDKCDLFLPWTDDLIETYRGEYGQHLLEFLPELFWELPGRAVSEVRFRFHAHVAKRFAEAFADNCGQWCRDNRLMLTGHLMEEPTLESQTAALGEAMLSYRAFDLPGIDILCDRYEFTTAKQAQSAVHQFGYCGMLSELYGVTNWDFDFRGHKLQGDWQAALGVTVRVPHLSWVSMHGEAKRDYPASIHYQSPWYKEYSAIENHFARLNTALTRGKALVRVGVIHPVESYWLLWGPLEQTADRRKRLEEMFQNLTQWLLFQTIDFDFISESLLVQQCESADYPLKVGDMAYEAIIIPGCLTIRRTTALRLDAFLAKGGKVIVMGGNPDYLDARAAGDELDFLDQAVHISPDRASLIEQLEYLREIDIRTAAGSRTDDLVTSIRTDGTSRWVFIARGRKPSNQDIGDSRKLKIAVSGSWTPTVYDTLTGEKTSISAQMVYGRTVMDYEISMHDSLLLRLDPGVPVFSDTKEVQKQLSGFNASDSVCIDSRVAYELSEPNVLLLDMAEFALDGGNYEPEEEILRLDNQLRTRLSWPPRVAHIAQPWVSGKEVCTHTLRLRFTIESEIDVKEALLAVEKPEIIRICLNGNPIDVSDRGYFADEAIRKIALPVIKSGITLLELEMPYGRQSHPEWCYLLGNFGVRVAGRRKTITPFPDAVSFGNLVTQGFPFYGGNFTYKIKAKGTGREILARIPNYRGALIGVELDGKRIGSVIFSPYEIRLPVADTDDHEVALTVFGTRINTFGTVHNCDKSYFWFGPNAWRTTGDQWSYEYVLKETGILKSPDMVYAPIWD